MAPKADIEALLALWNGGDAAARDELVALLYPELRRLAAHMLNKELREITLQTTEIVHEAYFRLAGQNRIHWRGKSQLLALAAELLRRVIIDHLRARSRVKRGGGDRALDLREVTIKVEGTDVAILALDRALDRLAEIDSRAARVVELRYFAGLDHQETADALSVSSATVSRSWRFARSWLRAALSGSGPPSSRPTDERLD